MSNIVSSQSLKTFERIWFLLSIFILLFVTPLLVKGLQSVNYFPDEVISISLLIFFAWVFSRRLKNIGLNPWLSILAIFPWLCLIPFVMGLVLPHQYKTNKNFKLQEWVILVFSISIIALLVYLDMNQYNRNGGTIVHSFSYHMYVSNFLR